MLFTLEIVKEVDVAVEVEVAVFVDVTVEVTFRELVSHFVAVWLMTEVTRTGSKVVKDEVTKTVRVSVVVGPPEGAM